MAETIPTASSRITSALSSGARCGDESSSPAASFCTLAHPGSGIRMQSSLLGQALGRGSLRAAHRPSASARFDYSKLIRAKKTGASKQYEAEVDKPLGLSLGTKAGVGVVITGIDGGGNAAKAGLKVGDQIIYTSSFFGDELWPSDNLGFTKTAIQAKPDSVYFVVNRGGAVDVKRLPIRPAPPRFGRKLTDAQKARATHICLDCGYIYTLTKPFEEQADNFQCPQCSAPKKRFSPFDPVTGRTAGGSTPAAVLIGVIAGAIAVGALAFFGLQ